MKHGMDKIMLRNALIESNLRMERAEVLLSNLLSLMHPIEDEFAIPFDDVVVALETAVYLLKE